MINIQDELYSGQSPWPRWRSRYGHIQHGVSERPSHFDACYNHGKHLLHALVDMVNAAVSARVVKAGRDFVYTE